jgi:hypothetical protein
MVTILRILPGGRAKRERERERGREREREKESERAKKNVSTTDAYSSSRTQFEQDSF